MLAHEPEGLLLLFFLVFDLQWIEVFRLKNLAAVKALHIIDAVAAGNHLGPGVIADGRHNTRFNEVYSNRACGSVKPP
jgi:hypothetical protein